MAARDLPIQNPARIVGLDNNFNPIFIILLPPVTGLSFKGLYVGPLVQQVGPLVRGVGSEVPEAPDTPDAPEAFSSIIKSHISLPRSGSK
jgi:hypothetical protein